MTSPSDRRQAARVRVRVPATVEVLGDTPARGVLDTGYDGLVGAGDMAGTRFDATIWDISTNGARLGASKLPPLMSRLSIRFSLPGYDMALAVCVVMWRRSEPASPPQDGEPPGSPGFGVRFEALDLGARRRIAELVAETASREPADK